MKNIINPTISSCENGKYLASITDNSVITCDETIDAEPKLHVEETKTVTKTFKEEKQCVKHKISTFYLHFY